MKSLLISAGLLTADFSVQAYHLWSRAEWEHGAGVLIAGGIVLLLSVRRVANDLFAALTEHAESFTV